MATFYYFPPWRRQFYFSKGLLKNKKGITLFYQPYIYISKMVWLIWKNIPMFRKLYRVDYEQLPPPFHDVASQLGIVKNTPCQVNLGTDGPEQKMTIIAYPDNEDPYFIKVGSTPTAIELISREANALKLIGGQLRVPKIRHHLCGTNTSILVTDVLRGGKLTTTMITEEVFQYIIRVNTWYNTHEEGNLFWVFSHGDCCPWNFVKRDDGNLVLIDWELSDWLPAGYDLLTFIFQTSFLLTPRKSILAILNANKQWLSRYFREFNVLEYSTYLVVFAKKKIENESKKKNSQLLSRWRELEIFLTK